MSKNSPTALIAHVALVLQIVYHQLGCNLTDTLTWVLTVSSADGHRIAVGNHLVGLFRFSFLPSSPYSTTFVRALVAGSTV